MLVSITYKFLVELVQEFCLSCIIVMAAESKTNASHISIHSSCIVDEIEIYKKKVYFFPFSDSG